METLPTCIRLGPTPVVALRGRVGAPIFESGWKVELLWMDNEIRFPSPAPTINYETYVTEGIIPMNWLHETCYLRPSVFILCLEWGMDLSRSLKWNAIEDNYVSEIEAAKAACSENGLSVILALVQVSSGRDEEKWKERAVQLTNRTHMPSKNVVNLHTLASGVPQEYFQKSVFAFRDLVLDFSSSHYHYLSRDVKKVRENVSPTAQSALCARLNFQIAFYGELRREDTTALKYYRKTNDQLALVKSIDIAEVKGVAECSTFRMCKILLHGQKYGDAELEMRRTISLFINKPGADERLFQHYTWLSRQYLLLGELLVKKKYKGDREGVQHPGYHYHAASNYAKKRREAAQRLCVVAEGTTALDTRRLIDSAYLGGLASAPPHPLAEGEHDSADHEANLIAQAQEMKVDHSVVIIELLTQAYDQFKKKSAKRATLMLAAEMAAEYCLSKRYEMALQFYERIAPAYETEGCGKLLLAILKESAECALQLGHTDKYLSLLLSILSNVRNEAAERESAQSRVVAALEGSMGSRVLPPLTARLLYPLTESPRMMTAVLYFPREVIYCHDPVQVALVVTLHHPCPLRVSSLTLSFTEAHEPSSVSFSTGSVVILEPGPGLAFPFTLSPAALAPLRPAALTVLLHSDGQVAAVGAGLSVPRVGVRVDEAVVAAAVAAGSLAAPLTLRLPKTKDRETMEVLPPLPRLSVSAVSAEPWLVGEMHTVALTIERVGPNDLTGGLVSAVTPPAVPRGALMVLSESEGGLAVSPHLPVDLSVSSHVTTSLALRCSMPIDTTIVYKVEYTSPIHTSMATTGVPTVVVPPFTVSCRFLSATFDDLAALYGYIPVGQRFVMVASVRANASVPLRLHDSVLVLPAAGEEGGAPPFSVRESKIVHDGGWTMVTGDVYDLLFEVMPSAVGPNLPLGSILLNWTRDSAEAGSVPYTYEVALPPVRVDRALFSTAYEFPAHSSAGTPFDLSVTLTNHSRVPQAIEATLTTTASFLMAGSPFLTFDVPPRSSYTVTYTLFPLAVGRVCLPHVTFTSLRYKNIIADSRALRFVFIEP